MNQRIYYCRPLLAISLLFIIIALSSLQSCNNDSNKSNKIEIITNAMDFQMADEIPSGWNTFHYINQSSETHFFVIEKYPEGKTLKDGHEELIPAFQKGMDMLNANKPENAQAEFGKIPEWAFNIVYTGGSGMVSPGQSSDVTVKLDPGYYVLECYVKNKDGIFHSMMGMTKELTVTDKKSDNEELFADVSISISSTDGIIIPDKIKKGETIFEVSFKDQKAYENFVGHDVNLVRLTNESDIEELENWMNWMDPKGLINPEPAGFTFLGGVNDMPAGSIGFFSADLTPGNYVLVSEVPDSSEKGLLKTFTVSDLE